MLQLIFPQQIPSFWVTIKDVIGMALPPVTGEKGNKLNNILTRLLEGTMECWVAFSERSGEKKPNGLMLTTIISDDITETKSLLIYCMATIEGGEPDLQDYEEGIEAWKKYARANGCNRVVAYTNLDYLVDMAEKIGGSAIYSFISFPI